MLGHRYLSRHNSRASHAAEHVLARMMNGPKLKRLSFFIATHKDAPLPPPRDNYVALGIGGYTPTTYAPALTDNVGDTISNKNNHYSELTGWYWIWKNIFDVEILGLCHYRRYFVLDENGFYFLKRRKKYFHPTPKEFEYLTAPERTAFVEKALSKYDVIVPQRVSLGMSISRHYAVNHVREDWELFIQGIQELFPHQSTHVSWFDEIQYLHAYNMMIASKSFFDSYMSSLFTLLFWMENKKPFRTEPYQCRVPAFIAERYFTFYLHAIGARYLEVPVAISEPMAF